jgi:hypothetical protein
MGQNIGVPNTKKAAVGMLIPMLAQGSKPHALPLTGQSMVSGLAITLASSWTFRSAPIAQIDAAVDGAISNICRCGNYKFLGYHAARVTGPSAAT